MPRIGTLATHNALVTYLLDQQSRLNDTQVQVSTEKKSQVYSGIARDSQRLVELENTIAIANRYQQNNDIMDLRLKATQQVYDGIIQTIRDFRNRLMNFGSSGVTDQNAIEELQKTAFRAMVDMQEYLNTEVDGQFLFAGSRVHTKPVELNLTSLSAFQSKYNGSTITYPTRESTHAHLKLTAGTGFPSDPTAQGYTTLQFDAAAETITAGNAGAFANIPVGASITIAGSGAGNNGTYTVTANTGTVITVANVPANEGPGAGFTMVADTSYYQGDTNSQTHRLDDDRTIDLDITALHPAFEKAIRAMGIIAQGAYGTAGGLDVVANQQRIDDAVYLLSSALDEPVSGTAPYGTETAGNATDLNYDLGFKIARVKDINARMKQFNAFLEGQVGTIENVDLTEAITKLTEETRALEASYKAMARVRELSLVNFL
jgi:flagellin-like hook-associated protein FlgL